MAPKQEGWFNRLFGREEHSENESADRTVKEATEEQISILKTKHDISLSKTQRDNLFNFVKEKTQNIEQGILEREANKIAHDYLTEKYGQKPELSYETLVGKEVAQRSAYLGTEERLAETQRMIAEREIEEAKKLEEAQRKAKKAA